MKQYWLFVALGIFFWLAGTIFVRYAGEALFHFGSVWLLGLFAATPLAAWVLIKTSLAVTGTPDDEALGPISVLCMTGLLLDGVAVSQFSSLYGQSTEHVLLGAAWLLWGVGVLILLAMIIETRASVDPDEATS